MGCEYARVCAARPVFSAARLPCQVQRPNIQATDAISGLSLWFETFQGDDFRADPRNPPAA
jgi:hypothetical protein